MPRHSGQPKVSLSQITSLEPCRNDCQKDEFPYHVFAFFLALFLGFLFFFCIFLILALFCCFARVCLFYTGKRRLQRKQRFAVRFAHCLCFVPMFRPLCRLCLCLSFSFSLCLSSLHLFLSLFCGAEKTPQS